MNDDNRGFGYVGRRNDVRKLRIGAKGSNAAFFIFGDVDDVKTDYSRDFDSS